MGNFCRLHGNTDEPCPECAAFQRDMVLEKIDELRALLRECEEPLRLLAASGALRERIHKALEEETR